MGTKCHLSGQADPGFNALGRHLQRRGGQRCPGAIRGPSERSGLTPCRDLCQGTGAFHLECSTQLRSDCTPLEQGGTTEDVTHPSVLLGPAWRAQCTRTPREPDRRSPCPPHLRLLPSWLHSSTVERGGALGGCPTSPWPPATRRPQQAEARLPQTQHRGTCGERWDGRARLQGAHPTFCEPPREGSEGTIRTGP